ncbi:MAG: hypothetical protein GXP09_04160 [Gammaproteobacteria bacterium]|nr:hypothetical protein [Gammaproteobacteria bacterium]
MHKQDPGRRHFLVRSMTTAILAVATGAGLPRPDRVLASAWPTAAFGASKEQDVLQLLYSGTTPAKTLATTIDAPAISENGLAVKIGIKTTLPHVQSISLLLAGNPHPLAMTFSLSKEMDGFVQTRYKVAQPTQAKVLVKSGKQIYVSTAKIDVTKGGCGG